MKDIRNSLNTFWNSFLNRNSTLPEPIPVKAFQTGFAVTTDEKGKPKAPDFPYITFELIRPDLLDFTVTSANVWCRKESSPAAYGLLDDILQQITEKIPSGGHLLDVNEKGKIWILRSNPFIQYMDEPDNQTIVRGIVRYIINIYTL